jgi:hypothetical protein
MPETPSGMPNEEDEIQPLGVPEDAEDEDPTDAEELPGFPQGERQIDG